MTDTPSEAPPGWQVVELGEILTGIEAGKNFRCEERPPKRGEVGIVKISAVTWGEFDEAQSKTILMADQVNPHLRIQTGDLLMSRANTLELVGASVVVGPVEKNLQLSDKVLRLRLGAPLEKWASLFLNSRAGRTQIEAMATGAQLSMRNISQRNIERITLPIPPFNEQRRIVERIETLSAQLGKGEEALREVQKLLARYRQSVLKAAFTGQLTADWREEHSGAVEHGRDFLAHILQMRRETWQGRGRYKEPVAPDVTDLPDLPDGWVWATVDQMLRAGLSNGRSVPDAADGFPVLRLTALKDGSIDVRERKIGAWSAASAKPFLIEQGDILVSRGSGSKQLVGRGGLVEDEPDPVAYPDTMIRIPILLDYLSSRWFLHLWNSPFMRSQIERSAKTTAGIYKINQTDIRNFVVPLPPLAEQEAVADLVDGHMSRAAELEVACHTELARSTALRQSIMKDAFAGRLVPQDPADEPADILLERIRKGRADAPKQARRKASTRAVA